MADEPDPPVPTAQLPLIYVNAVAAYANPIDAAFDVGYRGPDGQVSWAARLGMSWEHVLLLRDVLNQAIELFETQNGVEIRRLQEIGHVHLNVSERAAKPGGEHDGDS